MNISPRPISAPSTSALSACPSNAGSTIPLSEPVAAALCSTPGEKPNYEHCAAVLACLVQNLFFETLNSDSFYLAMARTINDCAEAGIPGEETKRVLSECIREWIKQRNSNPLKGLF